MFIIRSNKMSEPQIFYYLGVIKFNNFLFNVYENKNHIKYYLKLIDKENNKLQYPLLEEFKQLNKMFYSRKYAMAFQPIRNTSRKSIRIIPQVVSEVVRDNLGKILKVELISLASALVLSGCAFANVQDKEMSQGQNIEVIQEQEGITDDTDIFQYDNMKFYNIDEYTIGVYEYSDDTVACRSIKEFKEKAGLKEDVSLEDLLTVLNENNNIPTEYKKLIEQRITNLATNKYSEGIDWSILYYNLERLKIEFKPAEEIKSENGINSVAQFLSETSTVVISEEFNIENPIDVHTFIHEVFHGINAAKKEVNENGKTKLYVYDGCYTILVDEGDTYVPINVGTSMVEALDELLTVMSEDKDNEQYPNNLAKIDDEGNVVEPVYLEAAELLKEMMISMGITYPELINNNITISLYNSMKEHGVYGGMDIMMMEDTNTNMLIYGEEMPFSFGEISGEFWYEYITNILEQNNVQSKEEAQNVLEERKGIIFEAIDPCLFLDADLTQLMNEYLKEIIEEYGDIAKINENNANDHAL